MAYQGPSGNTVEAYTQGMPPLQSLNAVSAVGAGTVLDGLACRATAVLQVNTSAGVSAGDVQLEGSLDGATFFNLGSAVSTTAASTASTVVVANCFVRFVRAAVTTSITGGNVSAWVGLNG
jgi:hypothetical protein